MDAHWDISDVAEANEVLDSLAEAEERAAAQQKR